MYVCISYVTYIWYTHIPWYTHIHMVYTHTYDIHTYIWYAHIHIIYTHTCEQQPTYEMLLFDIYIAYTYVYFKYIYVCDYAFNIWYKHIHTNSSQPPRCCRWTNVTKYPSYIHFIHTHTSHIHTYAYEHHTHICTRISHIYKQEPTYEMLPFDEYNQVPLIYKIKPNASLLLAHPYPVPNPLL